MEIFLVQCEYTIKDKGIFEVSQAGYSASYQIAKEQLHKCIDEEKAEGNIPKDFYGWTSPKYEDEFLYETENTRLLYYVCSVDSIVE